MEPRRKHEDSKTIKKRNCWAQSSSEKMRSQLRGMSIEAKKINAVEYLTKKLSPPGLLRSLMQLRKLSGKKTPGGQNVHWSKGNWIPNKDRFMSFAISCWIWCSFENYRSKDPRVDIRFNYRWVLKVLKEYHHCSRLFSSIHSCYPGVFCWF